DVCSSDLGRCGAARPARTAARAARSTTRTVRGIGSDRRTAPGRHHRLCAMVRIRTAPRPHPGVAAVALLRLRDAALVLLVAAGACHAPDDGERPGPAGPSAGGEAAAPDPGAADPGGAEPDATPEGDGETPGRPPQGGFVSEPAEGYDGPPVTAVLEVMESFPEQYAVAVEVTAPTGGHELEPTATRKAEDGATEHEP